MVVGRRIVRPVQPNAPINIFKGSSTATELCGDVEMSFDRNHVNIIIIPRRNGIVVTSSVMAEVQTLAPQ